MPDVRKLVFGTAALGMPYGVPRSVGAKPIDEPGAAKLVRLALDAGIDTFDTAPAYGFAEERLGRALGSQGTVWTKTGGRLEPGLLDEVLRGLDRSLDRLKRPRVELLQWHNWTADLLSSSSFRQCWSRLETDPRVGKLGATTYGVADALAAVRSGLFRVVQVEWNLLNPAVVDAIANDHARSDVTVAVRSVFLQGALTDDPRRLPDLATLRDAVEAAHGCAGKAGIPLADLALRAALDLDIVAHVLVGIDRAAQIQDATRVAGMPRLGEALQHSLQGLSIAGDPSVDPRTWHYSDLTPTVTAATTGTKPPA